MQKFLSDFVLAASTLIFVASVAIYLASQNQKTIPPSNSTTNRTVYVDNQGYLKYSFGSCTNDSDCVPAGCSGQICSNDPGLITTCEIREDFPSQDIYSCGCVSDFCAWFEK